MIISFLSQKGGVCKSSLARATAVEFTKSGWDVHVADMDTRQMSTLSWLEDRREQEITPMFTCAGYPDAPTALRAKASYQLLIIDGPASADRMTKAFAEASDLIVLPTGVTKDDLRPQLNLANDLALDGIPRNKIVMAVMKVPAGADKEAMRTRRSIQDWGFDVAPGWHPMRVAIGQAMDNGLALTETRYSTLNERADKIVQFIADRALSTAENVEEIEA